MFDTPVSAETDSAETASRPLASEQPASRPAASQPPASRPLESRSSSSRPSDPRPLDSRLADSRPADSRPSDPRPADSQEKCPDLLANEITTLAGHLNAAQYRFLKLLDEFDREQGWAGPGVRSLAHWLNWKCGLGDLVAREKVRVARALRELPLIDAAFEQGEISYSKVRAMTRAATPKNETQLLNIARHGTAAHMERLVRVYRRCRKRVDTSPVETEIRREERFCCFEEDDETMVLGGRVSVEQGRLLVKALDAMVAEMENDEREAGDAQTANVAPQANVAPLAGVASQAGEADESGETHEDGDRHAKTVPEAAEKVSAETSSAASEPNVSVETSVVESDANSSSEVSAATSGQIVSAETFSDGKPDTPPFKPLRVRRATALVHIAEHYLATRGSGATAMKSSDAYQVFVHVNANDAHPDNRINGAHTIYMDDRRSLAPHVARQLACDASRRTVLENERGEVLNIGRRSRIVPWHIAHALRIRDGGCRFPGCSQHRWTDAHHIHHWADGGETSLDNLVTLCRYHHRALHRDEYRIEHRVDGELIFIDAQHQPIPPAIHPQFGGWRGSDGVADTAGASTAADRVEQLQAEHRERGVEIDKSTAVTRWAGERMDYSTAVEWLQYADGVVV